MPRSIALPLSIMFSLVLLAWPAGGSGIAEGQITEATQACLANSPDSTLGFPVAANLDFGGTCTMTCLAENRECQESDEACALVFEICMDLCENPPPHL